MASHDLEERGKCKQQGSTNGNGLRTSQPPEQNDVDFETNHGPSKSILVHQIRSSENHAAQHVVWDVEQALQLRKEHGILGDFVGTLPKHLSQNQFLTLPLLLGDDEVTYGVDKGVVHVVSDNPEDYKIPTEEISNTFWKERDADIHRQIEETVIQQREERMRRVSAVTPRKRKLAEITPKPSEPTNENVQKQNRLNAAANSSINIEGDTNPAKIQRTGLLSRVSRGVRAVVNSLFSFSSSSRNNGENLQTQNNFDEDKSMSDVNETLSKNEINSSRQKVANLKSDDVENEEEKKQRLEDERQQALDDKSRHQARLSSLVVTSTTARDDEIAERIELSKNEEGIPCPPGMTSERRKRRRQVFDDLREKGYVISCGAKFGADFLAYAGDPQLFHAALAVVVVNGEEEIAARDIVALGRLGDSTRKRTVLAWVDETLNGVKNRKGEVHYVGVQWEETLP